MSANVPQWLMRMSDFNQDGWHTKPTAAYQLMFEFLRLSPSYELARKHRNEGLVDEERSSLPSDFDQVLKTYDLCGDVQTMLFKEWWQAKGLKLFGKPYEPARVRRLALLKHGKKYSQTAGNATMENFLRETHPKEGLEQTLIVTIPLNLKRSVIQKQLATLLNKLPTSNIDQEYKPLIKMEYKRFRRNSLFAGLKLLWIRAAKPKLQLWRFGALAGVSKEIAPHLNYKNPRRVISDGESYDREMMTKVTSRALKKYEAIAENAARGRFPTDVPPAHQYDFNYPALAKRIQVKNAWEKKRKLCYQLLAQ